MTYKRLWLTSGIVGSIIVVVSIFSIQLGICSRTNSTCSSFFDQLAEVLLPTIPLLVFCLLTWGVDKKKIDGWLSLISYYVPFSFLLIALTPEYSGDWMFGIEKGMVAVLMSALLVILSLGFFAYQHFRAKS